MIKKIKKQLNLIRIAFSFFTRIPVGSNLNYDNTGFYKSMWFAPLVGSVIGLVNVLSYLLLNNIFSMFTVSILLLLMYVIVTGALHIDGLGDFFDGILSGKKGDKLLEVMRDSKIGAGGIIGILFYLLLTIALFIEIGSIDRSLFLYVIFLGPIVSRSILILLPLIFSYPEDVKEGIGKGFIDGKKNIFMIFFSIIFIFTFSFLIFGLKGVFSIFLAILISLGGAYLVSRKLKGITGDMLGGIIEMSQLVFLFSCYLVFYII